MAKSPETGVAHSENVSGSGIFLNILLCASFIVCAIAVFILVCMAHILIIIFINNNSLVNLTLHTGETAGQTPSPAILEGRRGQSEAHRTSPTTPRGHFRPVGFA